MSQFLNVGPIRVSRGTARRWAGTVFTQFVILGLGVVAGVSSGRLLSPQLRGELAAITIWPLGFVLILSFGINQAIVFHTARKSFSPAQILTGAVVIAAIQSAAVILLGEALIPVVLKHYSSTARTLSRLLLFSTPALILPGYLGNIFQGEGELGTFDFLRLLAPGVYAVGVLWLLALKLPSVHLIVAAQIAGYCIALACAVVALYRAHIWELSLEWRVVRGLFSYGARSHVTSIASYLNQRVDQFVLSLLISSQDLGLYALAATLSMTAAVAPSAIGLLTFTHGSRQSEDQVRLTAAKALRVSMVAGGVVGVALFFLARPLTIFFLGHRYEGSVPACKILLPGVVGYGITQVLYGVSNAMEKPSLPSIAEGAGLLVTAVGLAALVPLYGYMGAAVVSTCGYLTTFFVMIFLSNKYLDFQILSAFAPSSAEVREAAQ